MELRTERNKPIEFHGPESTIVRGGFYAIVRPNCAAQFLAVLFVPLVLSVLPGCKRSAYRQRADDEVYRLVQEKTANPHWSLPNYSINIDPRSRMFSPNDPDRPPMPPDDPAAHRFMHRVDDKPGYPGWDANGHTPIVENPNWLCSLPLDEDGVLKLDADSSVRLSLLHSPNYQQELEELYLSALDVSFERFVFDSQLFGGYSAELTADGHERAGGGGQSQSNLDVGFFSLGRRPISLQKAGITGSTLVVGLANRLIWQFSGPNTHSPTTLLDFSIVQPLLRGAGRDRIMERLTLSERSLLSNVRAMERYRRGFYVDVMTGQDAGDGPSRRGGVFGGSGLGGFSGVGGGGFGQVVGGNFGGGGIGGGTGDTGAGQAGGYLGLLQSQKSIRNQETNVTQLRSSLIQFQEFARANRIDYLQVQQSQQALYNAQSSLLNSKTRYKDQLDRFKSTLGLPPQIEVEISDGMLSEFNLLDPTIERPQNELNRIQREVGELIVKLLNAIKLDADGNETLKWSDDLNRQLRLARSQLADAERIRQQILTENVRAAQLDTRKLKSALRRRVADMERFDRRVKEESRKTGREPAIASAVLEKDQLILRAAKVHKLLDESTGGLRQFEASFGRLNEKLNLLVQEGSKLQPDQLASGVRRWLLQRISESDEKDESDESDGDGWKPAPFETDADVTLEPLSKQLSDLAIGILELSLVQARARADSVTLVPIDLDSATALEIARDYRRDWMNRRAALVDTWRLIEFNADNLESTVDVIFEGDIGNTGDNPIRLDDSTGRLRAGIQIDAPITRLDERNTYRQSLIEYQQARRNYYRFRDGVSRDLRANLRAVELNQLNFELRRSAILVAIEQVELARLRLQEPPEPNQPADGQRLGATTARDLVSALSDLLNAQNDFISVWVTYEVLRRSLDFNLGTMQIDHDGIWVDPGEMTPEQGYPRAGEYISCVGETSVLPVRGAVIEDESLEKLPEVSPSPQQE